MKKQTLLLPAGAEFLEFGGVARLVAEALHPEHDADEAAGFNAGYAQVNLEAELQKAALQGVLPLRDPLTLASNALPSRLALVSVDDLRAYFTGRLTIQVDEAAECEPVQAAPVKVEAPAGESISDRRTRRLRRFEELGGEARRARDGWNLNFGKRGAMAQLIREEKAAGAIASGRKEITKDLKRALDARHTPG